MFDSFFADLDIPAPDFHLEIGYASHAIQTARIMTAFEPIVLAEKPDWVLVVVDVNELHERTRIIFKYLFVKIRVIRG